MAQQQTQHNEEELKILNIVLQDSSDEEQHEEHGNNKYIKKKHTGSGGIARYMIIAIACLLGFVAIIFILPSDISNSKKKSTIRHAIKPTADKDERTTASIISLEHAQDDEEESKIYSIGTNYLDDAKKIVINAEEEALSNSNEYISDILKDVEVTIKKAIEQLLLEKRHGYSSDEVTDVENEIFNKLEMKVHQQLKSTSTSITKDAEQDMDTIFENDVLAKVDLNDIEKDVDAMREYFVDEAQKEVDYVAQDIKKNIREIVEGVEKEVIAAKLDIDADGEDLENAELEAQVSDVMKDIDNIEKKDFSNIETNLSKKIKKTNDSMKLVLRDFLINEKGLSVTEVDKIEEEISKRIEQEVTKNIEDRTESLEEQVDQAMHIELDGLIEEDKYILDRAKKLGLVTSNNGVNGDKGNMNKDVDLIERDISGVRDNFDEYLEDLSKQITSELKNSMPGILENVEKKVLEEKGVKVTQNEMDYLIKEEEKN